MACGSCGSGNKTVSPQIGGAMQMKNANSEEMVLIQYVGAASQKRRLRSKARPREQYVFSKDQDKFWAYRADAAWLTNMVREFRLVPIEPIYIDDETSVVLSSDMRAPEKPADLPLDVLNIDSDIISRLRKRYNTINELRYAGRGDWLTVSGIGGKRADEIQEALNALP